MKAITLKKKYPNYWNHVETMVIDDMRQCMPQSMVVMSKDKDEIKNCRIHRVAYNAAFFATSKYHEYIKKDLK